MIQDAIRKVVAGESLTRAMAAEAAGILMEGEATPAQIAALLVALRMKGETVEEATGFAQAMRSRVVAVHPNRTPLLDTCGTGGSLFRTFNVSTAAAFVAASAGIAVAKHGNRAMSGVCGSADVLEALGVCVTLTPEQCAASIDTVGIGFLFAQYHHPAMKHVGGPRREIGIRTLFNLIGPLTNPAGAKRQVMGVYSSELVPLAAGVLKAMGSERALVVHGEMGMDEISLLGATRVCELREGEITGYTLTPALMGFEGAEPDAEALSPAASPAENAAIVREVLEGRADSATARARRDMVAVNAAAALRVCGLANDWPEAVQTAQSLLQSGKPLAVMDRLIAFTSEFRP